jgi:hypothetical protein
MTSRLKTQIKFALSLVAALSSPPAGSQEAEKPNIFFILMDNVGWGEIGVYGGGLLRGAPTPRLDSLASEGRMDFMEGTGAADRLGLKPSTLRSRMQRLGISRP